MLCNVGELLLLRLQNLTPVVRGVRFVHQFLSPVSRIDLESCCTLPSHKLNALHKVAFTFKLACCWVTIFKCYSNMFTLMFTTAKYRHKNVGMLCVYRNHCLCFWNTAFPERLFLKLYWCFQFSWKQEYKLPIQILVFFNISFPAEKPCTWPFSVCMKMHLMRS